MADITKENILQALEYIDKNGVPVNNQSIKYDLVSETGKKYPPKYVIAVAHHLANDVEINTEAFNSVEARRLLREKGFLIETKTEAFELVIMADEIKSTDPRFDINNLGLGDKYKPINVRFEKANGDIISRNYRKGERRNSNQTMPRIACQVFEKQIASLSLEEKEAFPVCKYTADGEWICGIFPSIAAFKAKRNTIEYTRYEYDEGRQFVLYCWNVFSTIFFVQECLKRFGNPGDKFVLTYREKVLKEIEIEETTDDLLETEEQEWQFSGYRNPYSKILLDSKNIIFRGAPGTGKSYLAKEIAADIVSDGRYDDYRVLSDEQKKQVEFVQFHPSYDYSDFVEGLRPQKNPDGSLGFELRDGIFKSFVDKARENFERAIKTTKSASTISMADVVKEFLSGVVLEEQQFETVTGNKFIISSFDDKRINVFVHGNEKSNKMSIKVEDIVKMLESDEEFKNVKAVKTFFNKTHATQDHSYIYSIYKHIIKENKKQIISASKQEELKKFVFIIDEINRGEISKILGELFFSIDPGYRGEKGAVSTQYSNLHDDPDDKFYIPENVYIIGTMNDIDRSVDTFDFAMRRRFRFIEVDADARLEMLDDLKDALKVDEAKRRMEALNKAIATTEGLNKNYQIGAAYFLKLKTVDFDQLWTDYLKPLLQEYVNGMHNDDELMEEFARAYGYKSLDEGIENESENNAN